MKNRLALQYRSNRLREALFTGLWKSAFKGQGIEFEEVRPYISGDDVRLIDWKVTARMNYPYLKLYSEEREMTVFFLVDCSSSMEWRDKAGFVSDIVSMLGFAAIGNHDKAGLILFTDEIELYVPPRRGRKDVLQLLNDLLLFKPKNQGTSIKKALEKVCRLTHKSSLIFLFSDFLNPFDYGKELAIASKKHDIVLMQIEDALEKELPPLSYTTVKDSESGETATLSLSEASEEYKKKRQHFFNELELLAKRLRLDLLPLTKGEDVVPLLKRFFKERGKWRR